MSRLKYRKVESGVDSSKVTKYIEDMNTQMMLVRSSPLIIKQIENPYPEVQEYAVFKIPLTVLMINPEYRTRRAEEMGVAAHPLVVEFLDDPREESFYSILDIKPELLLRLDNPSLAFQRDVIIKNTDYIEYLNNPDPDIVELARRWKAQGI